VAIPIERHGEISVGVCIDDGEFGKRPTGEDCTLVSCAGPLDNEIYAMVEFPEGPYPGEDAVTDEMTTRCAEDFWAYVGDDCDCDNGVLGTSTWWPTQSGWESGYRIGTCMLLTLDGDQQTGPAYWRTGRAIGRPSTGQGR